MRKKWLSVNQPTNTDSPSLTWWCGLITKYSCNSCSYSRAIRNRLRSFIFRWLLRRWFMIGRSTLWSKILWGIAITGSSLELNLDDVLTLNELFNISAASYRINAMSAESVIANSCENKCCESKKFTISRECASVNLTAYLLDPV